MFLLLLLSLYELCNINLVRSQCASDLSCDDKDYEGCAHKTQICGTSDIFCRGNRGCYDGSNSQTIKSINGYNTYCNGDDACYQVNTIGSDVGSTYCQGNRACYSSTTIYGEYGVYCKGKISCNQVSNILSNKGSIYCDGEQSCTRTNAATSIQALSDTSNGNVYCNGRNSCYGITSINAGNKIICDGGYSCASISTINGGNEVLCSGTHSCQAAASITGGKNVYCQSIDSCSHTTSIIATNGDIYCSGKRSCYNSGKLEANNGYLWCESAQSCMYHTAPTESNIIANVKYDVYCNGLESCKYLHMNIANGMAQCDGEKSCQQAMITAKTVVCETTSSCSSATIKGAHTIDALGPQSLGSATIDTTGVSEITIRFFGYASGDSTHIYCRAGTTCNVYCIGNACTNLIKTIETGAVWNQHAI